MLVCALIVVGMVTIFPAAVTAVVWQHSRHDDSATTHAIVVLGAAQYNGVPSKIFRYRIEHAATLYKSQIAPVIITVGGKVPGDFTTEAEVATETLTSAGIPAQDVITIPRGRDTWESLNALTELRPEMTLDSITLVTDPSHSFRSEYMAKSLGFHAVSNSIRQGPAVSSTWSVFMQLAREAVASIVFFFSQFMKTGELP